MVAAFRFPGHTRRIAWTIVDALAPRWPGFEVELTDEVLLAVEASVAQHPATIRAGMVAALTVLELSGPLVGELRPLTRLDRAGVEARLRRLSQHRLPQIRLVVFSMHILTSLAAYSRPDVEAFLGVERRSWREGRRRLHEALVQIDAGRAPVPAALGTGALSPERFLDSNAHAEVSP